MDFLETIFTDAKGKLLNSLASFLPEWILNLFSSLIDIVAIILIFSLLFGVVTVIERKLLGRIQNRYGPNRVGPYGFFQFIADGIKALTKEDIVPTNADKVVHYLAPIVMVAPVLLTYSVIPFGKYMTALNLNGGILFFFAIGAFTELSVFMAGWSSRNKYSLLGAMRAIAQMLSYELCLIIPATAVIMIAGTLSTTNIVEAQNGYLWGFIPNWYIFTPWGIAAFLVFFTASIAELNRSPFDLPEGESEIIAGYYIEYSGFKFALFFLAEYFGMFATSGIAITLFFGGWRSPLPFLEFIPSYLWFFLKLFIMIFIFIWLRGTLPRVRIDQLMNFSWKFLLPMSLITLLATALWHYIGGGISGWIICGLIILIPYFIFSKKIKEYSNSLYLKPVKNLR